MSERIGILRRWREDARVRRLREAVVDRGNHVRGFHGGCPARKAPAVGSSYDALSMDDQGRICCSECGAVDLATKDLMRQGLILAGASKIDATLGARGAGKEGGE